MANNKKGSEMPSSSEANMWAQFESSPFAASGRNDTDGFDSSEDFFEDLANTCTTRVRSGPLNPDAPAKPSAAMELHLKVIRRVLERLSMESRDLKQIQTLLMDAASGLEKEIAVAGKMRDLARKSADFAAGTSSAGAEIDPEISFSEFSDLSQLEKEIFMRYNAQNRDVQEGQRLIGEDGMEKDDASSQLTQLD